MRMGIFVLGLVLASFGIACTDKSSAKAERLCTPGNYVYCRCKDLGEGTKLCKESGQAFETCAPCDGSGDTGVYSGGDDGLGAGHGTDIADSESASSSSSSSSSTGGFPMSSGGPGTTAPPGGADAGSTTRTGNEPKPQSSAAHCEPLTNIAPKIEVQRIADVADPVKGGKPGDGVYVQSWVVEFTGEGGATGPSKHYSAETIEIKGDVGRFVFEDGDGTKSSGGFRLTAKSESVVTVAYECPAAPPKDLTFEIAGRKIILYDPPYARVFVRKLGSP